MRWFTLLARPARPAPVRRTRLGLEALADRAVPSSLTGDPGSDYMPLPPPPPPPGDPGMMAPPPGGTTTLDAAAPPRILDFQAVESSPGWFRFTGRVDAGASSGGQTVKFGGIPALNGASTFTLSDGSFSTLVWVGTDGSGDGTASAQTTVNGVTSDMVYCNVSTS